MYKQVVEFFSDLKNMRHFINVPLKSNNTNELTTKKVNTDSQIQNYIRVSSYVW